MISENLSRLSLEIDTACRNADRSPDDVRLMGVSKRQDFRRIQDAYDAGLRLFGENRVQETKEKWTERALPGVELHLIGHLQRNKARDAAHLFDAIESIDRIETAEALQRHLQSGESTVPMPILLEMNTSGEARKSGVTTFDDLMELLDGILEMDRLVVRGLMTVAPFTTDKSALRSSFALLRTSRDRIAARFPQLQLHELSMGMSGDFPEAIAEGSTLLRVGTAIFGDRIA